MAKEELPEVEVTIEVDHPKTGKCELDGQKVKITYNKNSYLSLNMDERTHCPKCNIALI